MYMYVCICIICIYIYIYVYVYMYVYVYVYTKFCGCTDKKKVLSSRSFQEKTLHEAISLIVEAPSLSAVGLGHAGPKVPKKLAVTSNARAFKLITLLYLDASSLKPVLHLAILLLSQSNFVYHLGNRV